MKNFFAILFAGVLYCIIFFSTDNLVNADEEMEKYLPILTKTLIFIVTECDIEQGTLLINYDDDKLTDSLWNKDIIDFSLIQWTGEFPLSITGVLPKINGFIINLNTTINGCKKIMMNYRKSPWWNVMVPFFLVYKGASGCKDAIRFLGAASQMYIIMTYFLCLDKDYRPTVYIFNPYSDKVLPYWTPVINTMPQYDKWTSFYRVHNNEYDFCSSFFFDRTKDIVRTFLKVTMPFSFNPEHEIALEPGKTYNESIFQLPLFPQMASMATTIIENMDLTLELVFENMPPNVANNPTKLFRRVIKGTSDLSLYPTSPMIGSALSITNPSMFSAYYVLAARTGQQSIIEKIIKFYSVWIFVLTFVIIVIVIAVVMKATRQNLSYALLEIIRLFIGTGVVTPLEKQSIRIFFSVILIYFLILQATFLGRLKTFVTGVVQRENVERVEDLRENYIKSIATTVSTFSFVQSDELKHKNVVTEDAFDCIQHVVHGKTSACIEDYMYLLEPSLKYDLHLSRSPISYNYYTYVSHKYWPLKNRLDKLLLHIREAGLSELWTKQITEDLVITAARKEARSEVHVKPLTLQSLSFAFQILLVGLTMSFLCFIFEVWSGRDKRSTVNPSKPIHRFVTHKSLRDVVLNKKPKKVVVDKKMKGVLTNKKTEKTTRNKNTKDDVALKKIKATVTKKKMTPQAVEMQKLEKTIRKLQAKRNKLLN